MNHIKFIIKKQNKNSNDFESSKILRYIQANKLACHSVMDGNRRHKTLKSEMKESLLLTATARHRVHFFFVPQRNIKRVRL